MINIKSQVAIEYLVIMGIVLLLAGSLTFIYFKYANESSYSITTSKADSILNEIVNAANQVNVYGAETQVKLNLDFPEGIQNITSQDKEITFNILTKSGQSAQISKVADVAIAVTCSPSCSSIISGKHGVIVKALPNSQVSIDIK